MDGTVENYQGQLAEVGAKLTRLWAKRRDLQARRDALRGALAGRELGLDPCAVPADLASIDGELAALRQAELGLLEQRREAQSRLSRHEQWRASPQGRRNLALRAGLGKED